MTNSFDDSTVGVTSETISNSGTYAVTADGAQGGAGTDGDRHAGGGLGAAVGGDIVLVAGTVLEIVVGGEGEDAFSSGAGGGGGGSFVFEVNGTTDEIEAVLAVAGGGGGGGSFGDAGRGGGTEPTGGAGGGSGLPGSGGVGVGGGGGGGYTGGTGGSFQGVGSAGQDVGTGFLGGAGGSYFVNRGGTGGVGGGGGGGVLGGGGGGGYGGGGGGSASGGGGGGGSYDTDLTNTIPIVDANTGNGSVTIDLLCFLEGTRIATPSGERVVETLRMGDLITTADGGTAPVRWIGRRTLQADGAAGYRFADPLVYRPIRITAGALGENLPARDLLVSMDHAVLIDGLLVQAGALVNGVSVVRETNLPKRFTYYHIELADHALVLAEGVPAETFVDNVSRMGFDNWAEHEALYGNEPSIAEMPYPRVQSRRQLPLALREKMDDRAGGLADAPVGLLAA